MVTNVQIIIGENRGKRNLLNAILALLAGTAAFIWPNYLYYIVGGFLIAIGLTFTVFQFSSILSAGSMLAGAFVIVFPNLIPYGFAFFLVVLGLTMLFSGGFTILGVISLLIAIILINNPGSIAMLIGFFLLFYGLNHIIEIIQQARHR